MFKCLPYNTQIQFKGYYANYRLSLTELIFKVTPNIHEVLL